MKFSIFCCVSLIYIQESKIYFKDEQGKFKIWQVGSFLEKYKKIETDIGEVEVFSYFYEPSEDVQDPNFLYLINYMEYPENEAGLDSLFTSLYDDTLESSAQGLGGELQYSTGIDMSGLQGRLSRIAYNNGDAIVKSKMILKEHRFYFIQVFTTASHSLNLKMDEFLDSFELINS